MKFEIDRIKQIELSYKIVAQAIVDLYAIDHDYNMNWDPEGKRINRLFQEDPEEIFRPEIMIRLMRIAGQLKRARELTFLNGEFSRPRKEEPKKK